MIKSKIGENAGHVWKTLENGESSLKAVKKATKLSEKDFDLALGWLSREDKIAFYDIEGEMFLRLN